MIRITLRQSLVAVALFGSSFALSGLGYHGWYSTETALAASAQEKAQARNSLNQVTAALRSVDTAYASGNAAEAQTKFEEARSNWDKIAPVISAREAREVDSLGKKLKDGAPPKDVKSTVSGMLEELRERHRARTALVTVGHGLLWLALADLGQTWLRSGLAALAIAAAILAVAFFAGQIELHQSEVLASYEAAGAATFVFQLAGVGDDEVDALAGSLRTISNVGAWMDADIIGDTRRDQHLMSAAAGIPRRSDQCAGRRREL